MLSEHRNLPEECLERLVEWLLIEAAAFLREDFQSASLQLVGPPLHTSIVLIDLGMADETLGHPRDMKMADALFSARLITSAYSLVQSIQSGLGNALILSQLLHR